MTTQQLSLDAALAGRDLALERLQESVPDWIAYAKDWLVTYLRGHETAFCDELWDAGLIQPKQGRALGVVVKYAIHEGWMIPTGEYRASVHSHGSVKAIYRSCINAKAIT